MNEIDIASTTPATAEAAPLSSDRSTVVRDKLLAKLTYAVGKDPFVARRYDWLLAASHVVRDAIIDRWIAATRETYRTGHKRVYYLSLEFLIGRLFRDAASNLNLIEPIREALASFGVTLDDVAEIEPDAALGNGGLGRLAACFIESMASVGIPAIGYGIRYEHGLFRQKIVDGRQIEVPEDWLSHGNPWEFERREAAYEIGFGGVVEGRQEWDGATKPTWKPSERVIAVAYDTPVIGWQGKAVTTLRLWSARSPDPMQLEAFNAGDHVGAVHERARAESISRVLYPADSTPAGQELRLRQEFFFTSASLQDLVRRHVQQFGDVRSLPEHAAVQLNDTHPAIAVAELMRLLVDVHGLAWDEAWGLTQETISYTNHTLLPEALETWPVHLMERMLPRHMQIIYAINARLLAQARRCPGADDVFIAAVSLIDEQAGRRVRMGNLAFAGSHKINGVSALHTELMKETVFAPLNRLLPGRITNKTNGITPRRWLFQANPGLTALLRDTIGDRFMTDTAALADLAPHAEDAAFREAFAAVKLANKQHLAALIGERTGIRVDPAAMFDVQVKRIHEYKRQLLNILETIALYDAIRADPDRFPVPRVKVFAGKAAASYWTAKSIIRLINDVARVVNADPAVQGRLKVVFLPNYNVSLAERIMPAADLSEQISTAGMEASGTGNMKFAMNGALTIGTLDGANVEIRDLVGPENIVIFGLHADEVARLRRDGYDPRATIEATPALESALASVAQGVFSPDEPGRYGDLVGSLYSGDHFLVAADFAAYAAAQRSVDALWQDQVAWQRKAVLNTAHVGWFSSDRTVLEYAEEIWRIRPRG
ncbi:glycogen/starch/alpha-glucan phosphorylase [Elioraea rosea]|uniref:glycogen/starch/alpha-glucan phosphorylase n=1 Tax=Elioraea rosea TaxID=2492390 RepID=UPI0011845470|nr:glycogen/starch/alpha-glucan phosphorylase [Elioraea rosea]